MFRKIVFWLHLTAGVITGVVVAMMSFTGVLLTYEHQLLQWDDRQYFQVVRADSQRLDVEGILKSARSNNVKVAELTFSKDERMPVLASEGRRGKSTYISQYTGENLGPPGARYGEFFRTVTSWHRWFAAEGDVRETGRLITGVSNLAFLFLVLSGAYLWLPRLFRWPLLRARLLFSGTYQNAKVRDYHWHHIFGIWSVIPLLVVVSTAVVFSFSWASALVSEFAGDSVAAPIEIRQSDFRQDPALVLTSDVPDLDELLSIAKGLNEDWKTITVRLPAAGSDSIEFVVNPGTGHQVQRRQTFTLSASTGEVVSVSGFEHVPAGRRARIFIRFLHTGEVYGLAGQTIAGLVSLASLFLVWTGFAQAWRRLILKPIRKRARQKAL